MKMSPKLTLIAIMDLKQRWETVCPERSFFGLTLANFNAGVQPSLDVRAALETLDGQRQALLARRHNVDEASMYLVQGVINAIKGDPTQGEDGELYGALGYVRKSMRIGGRSRARTKAQVQAPDERKAANGGAVDAAPKAEQEVSTENQAA